jgi:quinol monooxygenase YgiN
MEDKLPEAIEMMKELVSESRKEAGCISYGLYQNTKDKKVLTMIEEWESQEDLDAHSDSEHYKKIIPVVRTFRESSSVEIYNQII